MSHILDELGNLSPAQRQQWVRELPLNQVLEMLEQLWELKLRQRLQGKKYRTKQQMLAKVARQYLDAGELRAIIEKVEEEL
jgi:hypothetical protein